MSAALALSRLIDAVNEKLGKIVAWAIVVAVLVSSGNAVARRVFGTSSNAWLELQWYLFGAVFMLAAAWTLRNNEHIRIDIVSSRLSKRGRNRIDVLGHLLFLIPFVALMIYLAVPFVTNSVASGEMSPNPGGLPIWPAKALVLAGFVTLALQALSELIKRIAIMKGLLEETETAAHGAEAEAERLLQELASPDGTAVVDRPSDHS